MWRVDHSGGKNELRHSFSAMLNDTHLASPLILKISFQYSSNPAHSNKWKRGCILAEAQNFARDLMESPSNLMTPTKFVETVSNKLGRVRSRRIFTGEYSRQRRLLWALLDGGDPAWWRLREIVWESTIWGNPNAPPWCCFLQDSQLTFVLHDWYWNWIYETSCHIGLEMDEHIFDNKFLPRSLSSLRFLHYPISKNNQEREVLLQEHEDSSFVMLLINFNIPGLEYQHEDGSWVDIVPCPGSLVVNRHWEAPFWADGRKAQSHSSKVFVTMACKKIAILFHSFLKLILMQSLTMSQTLQVLR